MDSEKPIRLSRRQEQVALMKCWGMSYSQMAQALGLKRGTIKALVNSLYVKIGINTRREEEETEPVKRQQLKDERDRRFRKVFCDKPGGLVPQPPAETWTVVEDAEDENWARSLIPLTATAERILDEDEPEGIPPPDDKTETPDARGAGEQPIRRFWVPSWPAVIGLVVMSSLGTALVMNYFNASFPLTIAPTSTSPATLSTVHTNLTDTGEVPALTPTAKKSETPPIATFTPSINPPVNTAAAPTQPPPTPLALPFVDTFDSGLRPEWKVVSGTPTILGTARRLGNGGFGYLEITVGDASLKNFYVEFDLVPPRKDSIFLYFGKDLRFHTTWYVTEYQRKSGIDWILIQGTQGYQLDAPSPAKLRFEVVENSVETKLNGQSHIYFEYGESITGPITLQIHEAAITIDNVTIDHLP